MSREDVEVVRRMLRLNSRRGLEDVKAVRALWHADCELTPAVTALDARTYHGHEGIADYVADMLSAFEDWSQSDEEIAEIGGGRVLASWWFEGRGRASGAAVTRRMSAVIDVDDRRVRRWRTFLDPADAYAAAGLDPPQRA